MSGVVQGAPLLVTGASGYLGSRLVDHFLTLGHPVTALVRAGSSLAQLEAAVRLRPVAIARLRPDYENLPEILADRPIETVVHVGAAIDGGDDAAAVRKLHDGNLLFPSLLLAAMKAAGIRRFVSTGTSWQNIDGARYAPFNLYAATKEAFEKILQHYVQDGLAAVTLRLFDVYGPDDGRAKLINLLKRIAASGEALDMTAGEQSIDLVHVVDACRAYGAALDVLAPGEHRIYNVSGHEPLSLRQVVDLFERVRGVRCPINWGAKPYRAREVMRPMAPYGPVPGWQPSIRLEDGLASV